MKAQRKQTQQDNVIPLAMVQTPIDADEVITNLTVHTATQLDNLSDASKQMLEEVWGSYGEPTELQLTCQKSGMPVTNIPLEQIATMIASQGYDEAKATLVFWLTSMTGPALLRTNGDDLAALAMTNPLAYCIFGLNQIILVTDESGDKPRLRTLKEMNKFDPIATTADRAEANQLGREILPAKLIAMNDIIRQVLSLASAKKIAQQDYSIEFITLCEVFKDEDSFDLMMLQLRETLTRLSVTLTSALSDNSKEALRKSYGALTNYLMQKSQRAKLRKDRLWMRYELSLDDSYLDNITEAVMNEPSVTDIRQGVDVAYDIRLSPKERSQLKAKLERAKKSSFITKELGGFDLSASDLADAGNAIEKQQEMRTFKAANALPKKRPPTPLQPVKVNSNEQGSNLFANLFGGKS